MSSKAIPAPFRGLNTRDAFERMEKGDAIILENLLPEADGVRTRDGYSTHQSLTGTVETVAEWRGPSSTQLITCNNGNIYNSSSTPSSLGSGFSEDSWQTNLFNGYLFLFNGTDTPQKYEGTTLSSAGYTGTGLTATNLVGATAFKGRQYVIEKNSANFWYGSAGGVTGAMTEFGLEEIVQYGGYIMAVGTWSRDGGSGLDDMLVFVMSSGEVIIYQGTNPASDFVKVGSYMASPPIGRRCLASVGGELLILTTAGIIPISYLVQGLSLKRLEQDPVYGKINPGIKSAAAMYRNNPGWQIFNSDSSGLLYVNIPTTSAITEQYVLNTNSGGWGHYTGINALCFCEYAGATYFGANAAVKTVTGHDDDGAEIVCRSRTYFDRLGRDGKKKRVTAVRPIFKVNGSVSVSVGVSPDFKSNTLPVGTNNFASANTGATWDEADWDSVLWGDEGEPVIKWVSARGIGHTFSVGLELRTTTPIDWYSTDVLYQLGGDR